MPQACIETKRFPTTALTRSPASLLPLASHWLPESRAPCLQTKKNACKGGARGRLLGLRKLVEALRGFRMHYKALQKVLAENRQAPEAIFAGKLSVCTDGQPSREPSVQTEQLLAAMARCGCLPGQRTPLRRVAKLSKPLECITKPYTTFRDKQGGLGNHPCKQNVCMHRWLPRPGSHRCRQNISLQGWHPGAPGAIVASEMFVCTDGSPAAGAILATEPFACTDGFPALP